MTVAKNRARKPRPVKFVLTAFALSEDRMSLLVPLRLVNPLNSRTSWRKIHSRNLNEASVVEYAFRAYVERAQRARVKSVHIERLAPKMLDSDNLAASAKHVRDTIAKCLGRDDNDHVPGSLQWSYGQAVNEAYGVRIVLHYAEAP